MTIWKFAFDITDDVSIPMPVGARLLDVQVQRGQPCLWAIVNPGERTSELRRFIVRGTGHPLRAEPDRLSHVGTFQMMGGELVFHVFEVHS